MVIDDEKSTKLAESMGFLKKSYENMPKELYFERECLKTAISAMVYCLDKCDFRDRIFMRNVVIRGKKYDNVELSNHIFEPFEVHTNVDVIFNVCVRCGKEKVTVQEKGNSETIYFNRGV